MTTIERFEIEAHAFHAMTGLMAPGKDEAMIANSGHTHEERLEAYIHWRGDYGSCVDAMMRAFEAIMEAGKEG